MREGELSEKNFEIELHGLLFSSYCIHKNENRMNKRGN